MAASGPLSKILRLLQHGTTEEQIAAAVVVGALAPKEKAAVQALVRCLEPKANLPLALASARALGGIGSPAALQTLLPLLRAEGELRETGALALAGCGKPALAAVRKELAAADPGTRSVLFRTLARMHSVEALRLVLEAFLEPDFELVKTANRALRNETGALTAAEKKAATQAALVFLRSKPVQKYRPAVNSTLIYLGALGHADAVPAFLAHGGPDHPHSTRRYALNGLRHTLLKVKRSARIVEIVFPYLDDADFEAVVEPTLGILEPADLPPGLERELRRHLGARFPQVRHFALRKLAALGTRSALDTVLEILNGKDEELRRSAARILKETPAAASLLLPGLLEEKDQDRGWALVHLIKPHAGSLSAPEMRRLAAAAVKFLDQGDRRAESLLHLFRHADEKAFVSTFLDRAHAARKARRYAQAERDLRLVSRSPHFDADARFLLALMELQAAGKESAAGSPKARGALETLRKMAEDPAAKLDARLKKDARALGPEGLYAVGFGLVEGSGAARALGAKLLLDLAGKNPRTRLGRTARAKLETERLA